MAFDISSFDYFRRVSFFISIVGIFTPNAAPIKYFLHFSEDLTFSDFRRQRLIRIFFAKDAFALPDY